MCVKLTILGLGKLSLWLNWKSQGIPLSKNESLLVLIESDVKPDFPNCLAGIHEPYWPQQAVNARIALILELGFSSKF